MIDALMDVDVGDSRKPIVRVSSMLGFFSLKCDNLKIAKQRKEILHIISHTC